MAGQSEDASERFRRGAMERGHGFAKMVLQSLFALNGGALVTIPTFAKFQGIGHFGVALIASLVLFVAGLVLTTTSGALAYFTSYFEATSDSRDVTFTLFAVLCAGGALAAFIAGVFVSASAFLSAPLPLDFDL
jgi:hypothetical protein